jgi:uroporphyrinogen-III decarboxylase
MSEQGKAPPFEPSPEYRAREKRFYDAVSLKRPDRVPIATFAMSFMTRCAGLTDAESLYDYERTAEAYKSTTKRFNFDMTAFPMSRFPGRAMELLGLKTFRWPGYNLDDNLPYQFVEKEYMTADEYDELLEDPGDFIIRKMMPRMAQALEPLAMVPPIHYFSSGYNMWAPLGTLAGMPPIADMLRKLLELGEEMNRYHEAQAKLTMELAAMGYPVVIQAVTLTAFDWVSDHFRGLKGAMFDMYRAPDKLKAAIELFTPMTINTGIMQAQLTGNPRVFVPLHRGADPFMSNEQFAEFYWPGLKKLLLALIDAGLTPVPWFEGSYTNRLAFLSELPPGKVAGHMDVVDKKKYKEILGNIMCFWGDVPPGLLVAGTPQEVKDYVKDLIDTFADTGGLIVDGGVEGIPAESKIENVEAMVETVFEYGVY